jgi:hypothetical protein
MWDDENIIHLHNRNVSVNTHPSKYGIIREAIGLELLIQKGIMVDMAINRLKQLAEEMK